MPLLNRIICSDNFKPSISLKFSLLLLLWRWIPEHPLGCVTYPRSAWFRLFMQFLPQQSFIFQLQHCQSYSSGLWTFYFVALLHATSCTKSFYKVSNQRNAYLRVSLFSLELFRTHPPHVISVGDVFCFFFFFFFFASGERSKKVGKISPLILCGPCTVLLWVHWVVFFLVEHSVVCFFFFLFPLSFVPKSFLSLLIFYLFIF